MFFFDAVSDKHLTTNMVDQTEATCLLAGVVAVGAIYVAQQSRHRMPYYASPSQCSARAANVEASARAANVVEAGTDFLDAGFAADHLSENFHEEMAKNAPLVNGGANSSATKAALAQVQPLLPLEPTLSNEIGSVVLSAGRTPSEAPRPTVTGGLMFYATEAYAQAQALS